MSARAPDVMSHLAKLVSLRLLDAEDALTAAVAAEVKAIGLTTRVADALDQGIAHWDRQRAQAAAEIRSALRPRLIGAAELGSLFPIARAVNARRGTPLLTHEMDRIIALEVQGVIAEGRRRGSE